VLAISVPVSGIFARLERIGMGKVWFITGASRGLGAGVATAALAAGDRVAATGRDPAAVQRALGETDDVLSLGLDVTDPASIAAAVNAATAKFGRIDVLVNNAGYGHLGAFEESTPAEVRLQFDTNVFGLMEVTRAVLPVMRRQRSGHVINISSIGGVTGFASCTLYGSSKFAVEGFSENLQYDVAPFGIHVTVVEPGFFRTDFLDQSSVRYTTNPVGDYAEASASTRSTYAGHNHQQLGDPAKLGPALVQLVRTERPPLHLLLGSDAVKFAEDALARRQAEIAAWRQLSVSTDYDA